MSQRDLIGSVRARGPRCLRWISQRPTLSASVIYLVLAVAMFAPALVPGKVLSNSDINWFGPPWASSRPAALTYPSNIELADAPDQLQVFGRSVADDLPHVPLWNPYIMGGRPFLANAQSAVFSPYSVPAYVMPFFDSLVWSAVLKLWVAAFGMFLLARALGMRFGGALLAGLVYGFNLWIVQWVVYPHAGVWSLIPWMLLAADRVIRKPDLLSLSGLAAVTAVQFLCGHPESSFQAFVATILFFVLRLVQTRRTHAAGVVSLVRSLLTFAGGLCLGGAVSALTLVPFGELLLQSADIQQRAGLSVDLHVPTSTLFEVFLPDYWGRATGASTRTLLPLLHGFYVGALPLMLACAALILRPRAIRMWVAAFGLVALCVVVGIPPFLQIVTRLPIFDSGHNSRLFVFYLLSLALLAGWGLDDICSVAASRARRRVVMGAAVVILALPVVIVAGIHSIHDFDWPRAFAASWGFSPVKGIPLLDPKIGDVLHLTSLITWVTLAALAVTLIAWQLRRPRPAFAAVALASALLVLDLFHAGMGYNPAIDEKYASQPATGAIRYLETQRPARFVSTVNIVEDYIPMRFGLYEARGYDFPIMRRYDRFWRQGVEPQYPTSGPNSGSLEVPQVTQRSLVALRLLGVSDILQQRTGVLGVATPPLKLPGLHLVYDGADARVYRLEGALPRALVVSTQQVVSGGEGALRAVSAPGFDARRVAVTERALPGLAPVAAGARAQPAGSAQIVSYGSERVVIRAVARSSGMVVLGDNNYPGWNASVDGRPASVHQVDYLFRGVPISAGTHTVVFRYEPLSWTIGRIITLLALLLLGVAFGLGRVRRVRTARAVGAPLPPTAGEQRQPTPDLSAPPGGVERHSLPPSP